MQAMHLLNLRDPIVKTTTLVVITIPIRLVARWAIIQEKEVSFQETTHSMRIHLLANQISLEG
jgi:hypothetical protein